jgi:hypothetical protein
MQCDDYQGDTRHGVYYVGNKSFYYKFNALRYASETKQEIRWDFNHSIFAEAAKKPRPNVPLETLYRSRAQQLRDQYDYVILAFSGGSDSDTALRAFTNNNIKLDEVWYDQPFEFISRSNYVLNTSTDSNNMVSEWFLVIKPELEKLQVSNPEIKIHCSDSCMIFDENKHEIAAELTTGLAWHGISRWHYIDQYINTLRSKHKRICLIIGVDKFMPLLDHKSYGFVFNDGPTFNKRDYTEYFFWTPDMPEILTEQAHNVWDYLQHNLRHIVTRKMNFLNDALAWTIRSKSMDQLIKMRTYPTWDLTKHQVDKQTVLFNNQFGQFVDQYRNERFFQATASHQKNILSQFDLGVVMRDPTAKVVDMKNYVNTHVIGTL